MQRQGLRLTGPVFFRSSYLMFKIIGADHKEYGPVTADQIGAWILEGRANGQTLVQVDGNAEWRALSSIPEFAAVLAAKLSSPPTPSHIVRASFECRLEKIISSAWSTG